MEKASLQEWSLYNGLDETIYATCFYPHQYVFIGDNYERRQYSTATEHRRSFEKTVQKLDGSKKYLINQAVKEYV